MKEGGRNFRTIGRVGSMGMALALGACSTTSPTPSPEERKLEAFQYRVTFQTSADVYVQLYADRARFPENPDGSIEDVIMIDVFCPDEKACEDLLEREGVSGSRVSLGGVDPMKYRKLEAVNQRNDYVACGLPVPSPFTESTKCESFSNE